MAICNFRKPYTSKPPLGALLNLSHPLAQGLVGCWLFNEGGGVYLLDSSGYNRKALINGAVWASNGLNFTEDYAEADWVQSGPRTWTWWSYTDTLSQKWMMSSETLVGGWGFGCFDTSGIFRAYSNSASARWVGNAGDVVTNKWQKWAVVYNGSSIYAVYRDGKLLSSSANNSGALYAGSKIRIGGLPEAYWTRWTGVIDNVYIHNRALSATEIASLHDNPYQMFYRPFQLVSVTAGGTVYNEQISASILLSMLNATNNTFAADIDISCKTSMSALANLICDSSISISTIVAAGEQGPVTFSDNADVSSVVATLMEYFTGEISTFITLACLLSDQFSIDMLVDDSLLLTLQAVIEATAQTDIQEVMQVASKAAVTFTTDEAGIILAAIMSTVVSSDFVPDITAEELLALSLVVGSLFLASAEISENVTSAVEIVDSYQYSVSTLLIAANLATYLTTAFDGSLTAEEILFNALAVTNLFSAQVAMAESITLGGKVFVNFDTGGYTLETIMGVKVSTLFEDIRTMVQYGKLNRGGGRLSSVERKSGEYTSPLRKTKTARNFSRG